MILQSFELFGAMIQGIRDKNNYKTSKNRGGGEYKWLKITIKTIKLKPPPFFFDVL